MNGFESLLPACTVRMEFKPMNDDVELKQRLSKLSDDELIEMVTVGANDYRQEALDYAKAELKYRRVDWSELLPVELGEEEEIEGNSPAQASPRTTDSASG